MGERDAVTILRTPHGERANKLYKANDDGYSTETVAAPPRGHYIARQVSVADCETLADKVLREIGGKADHVACPGLFKDAPEGEFQVLPLLAIAQHLQVDPSSDKVLGWHEIGGMPTIARLKRNMLYSSFLLFDRDSVPGMPPALAGLDLEEWLTAMAQILPSFATAAKVILPSSSTRLLVDGRREPWAKNSLHCYIQVVDQDELDRVWPQLLVQAFHVDLGFMRPKHARDGSGVVVAEQAWSIYDPSTCSPERLVFDGAPTLLGGEDWLSLAPCEVWVLPGEKLDLSEFADLPKASCVKAGQKGIRLETTKKGANGHKRVTRRSLHNASLKLELEVETPQGLKTIRQIWIEGHEHLRCQSPFRESSSWAAFISLHRDGSPFLHDSGANTNYVLAGDDALGPTVKEFIAGLGAWLEGRERIAESEDIQTAYGFARRVIGAAARRDWSKGEMEVLAGTIADKLYKPFGVARSRMVTQVQREVRSAMQAPIKEGDGVLTPDEQDDLLEELNSRYCFVLLSGKARIIEPRAYDPCLERHYLLAMGTEDFDHAYCDRMVPIATSKGVKLLPLGPWWRKHPERRKYLGGVVCDPAATAKPEFLNLWQGFNVDPAPGDISIFQKHIELVTSGGGLDAYTYFVNWLSYKVQHPGEQMDVATVLKGGRGVGKSVIGHIMIKIFGTHAMHISQGEQMVGKFNSHLMDCCFLFADEAFFAGDRRHNSVLKALITEPTIVIEPKGVNAFQMRNRVGLFMASNEDWVVPTGRDERRFFVLDVPPDKRNDRFYFKRLWSQVNDRKAVGAFLDYLLKLDLSKFEIRDVPHTSALDDQKIESLPTEGEWLMECLDRGWVCREEKTWKPQMMSADLYQAYHEWCISRSKDRYMRSMTAFGRWLNKIYDRKHGEKGSVYRFGTLKSARKEFEVWAGFKDFEW